MVGKGTESGETQTFTPHQLSGFQLDFVEDEIIRSTILNTIEMHLEKGEMVVAVQGEEGMGKSTLLGQFLKQNNFNTIGVFLDSINRQSYVEDKIVIDLYRQAYFLLNGVDPEGFERAGKRELAKTFYALDTYLRKNSQCIYLIVDGLGEIPERDRYIVDFVIDILPFSERNIKILISSSDRKILSLLPVKRIKEIEMVVFSEHEAAEFFQDVDLSVVKDIVRIFRGIPGNLTIIKRLLKSGMTAEEILQDYSASSDSADLYDAEWDRSRLSDPKDLSVLATIAFSVSPISIEVLMGICERNRDEISDLLGGIGFLSEANGLISFSSKGMKLYVRSKLKKLEGGILSKIVDYYERNPESQASLSELNLYNDKLGRFGEIVNQLSSENIGLLFEKSKSLNESIKQIKLGRKAASKIVSLPDTLRLAHAESILSGLRASDHLENEIRCYLTDNDYDSAMGLTSEATMVEERLQLLATIAGHQKEKNDKVDEDIIARIDEDFKRINPEHLGIERATDLASELFPVFPEKALSLINRIDSLDQSGGNKSDYALFRLSMNMVRRNNGSIDVLAEKVDGLEDKKKEALSLLGLFKRGTPADKIIKRVEEFDEAGDAIFVLRHWANSFPEDKNTYHIVNKLLSLIVSTTDYHANASVYADISSSLPFMSKDKGLNIVRRIDPVLETMKKIGPSIDYVRIQCHHIIFEEKNSVKSDRLLELEEYLENGVSDLSVKLSALCMIHQFSRDSQGLGALFDFDAKKAAIFDSLIGNSADHISLVKDALLREVELSFSNAISWASRLNNRPRRDCARAMVIRQACEVGSDVSVDRLCQEVRCIKNRQYQNDAVTAVFRFCAKKKDISKSDIKRLGKLRNRIKNSIVQCRLDVELLKAVENVSVDCSEQRNNIIQNLGDSYSRIEGNWLKIRMAYEINNLASDFDNNVSSWYREKAIELRKLGGPNNESVINSQVYSSDLIVRTFYFLCKHNVDSDEEFSQVCSSIKLIPSRLLRIKQTARLCSALRLSGKINLENQLIEDLLLEDYDSIGDDFSREYAIASFWALPILFRYSRSMFDRKLEVLGQDEQVRDEVLSLTQNFIINETLLGDPFDPVKNHKYDLGSGDIENYIYLISEINEESRTYFSLRRLVNIVVKGGRNKYSRVQRKLVFNLLSRLENEGFSSDDHLQHSGYQICCRALSLKLSSEKNRESWRVLVERVWQVPVASDRVFILGQIIDAMPSSLIEYRKELLHKAVSIVDSLKAEYERISRFEYLAEVGAEIDRPFVKRFVERAVLLTTQDEGDAYEEKRLSLIDSLSTMDKDFASSLSAMVDDDPARKRLIEENVRRKKQERLEKEEFDVSSDDISSESISPKYPNMIWSLLGKLNANNHVPAKRSDYQKFLNSVSQYPFEKAYPMISYFVHVKGVAAANQQLARDNMKPIFDVLVNANNLFRKICILDKDVTDFDSYGQKRIVFGEGELEEVLGYVKTWLSGRSGFELLIVDPYFSLEDFDFIGEAINKDPDFDIKILTSYSNLKDIFEEGDPGDIVNLFWRDNVSSDSMPKIDIIFCGLPSIGNAMPVHDRWWIVGDSGLDFGGSLNGIGRKRISSISEMNNQEVIAVEKRIAGFIDRSQRTLDGERIKYQVISP